MFPMDFQVPPTDGVIPKSREVACTFTWRWLGQVGLGRRQMFLCGSLVLETRVGKAQLGIPSAILGSNR